MTAMDSLAEKYRARAAKLAEERNPLKQGVAWIEGSFTPISEARIPLLDQGFLHSDLTYDVPAVWDGRFFRLDDHLDRLEKSCAKLKFRNPLARAELRKMLLELVAMSGLRDAYVNIIVTRGQRFVRELSPEPVAHTLYAYAIPYLWIMPLDMQRTGGSAIVTRTVRRIPPGAIDPTVKNLQWGDFTRGVLEAAARDSAYPILPDGDGNITEGAGYNVFVVKDGVMRTPRLGVLEGVTRRTVLELAAENGWPTAVEEVPVDLLYDCEEIFLASTAGGVMPITELDGQPVGGGQVGPVARKVWEAYWAAHYDTKFSFQIDYKVGALVG